MDMNSKELCKDCWYKKEDIKYTEAVMKSWKTRRKKTEKPMSEEIQRHIAYDDIL